MWTIIVMAVVIFVILWVGGKFADASMTDEQKNDNTPVFYKDENGEMHKTTMAEMKRQEISNGCIWVIGVIIVVIILLIYGH